MSFHDSWREFLTEDGDFYSDEYYNFVEKAKRVYKDFENAYGEEFIKPHHKLNEFLYNLQAEAEDYFSKIDEGANREAFQIGGARILKVAKNDHGIINNKDEMELSYHSQFSDIVLQVEDVGLTKEYPFWIVSEEVDVFDDCSDMVFYFPAFKKNEELVMNVAGNLSGLCIEFQNFLELSIVARAGKDLREYIEEYIFQHGTSTDKYIEFYREISKEAGDQLKRLKRYVIRKPVDLIELGNRNAGVDKEGNFVLIDPSITPGGEEMSKRSRMSKSLKEKKDV